MNIIVPSPADSLSCIPPGISIRSKKSCPLPIEATSFAYMPMMPSGSRSGGLQFFNLSCNSSPEISRSTADWGYQFPPYPRHKQWSRGFHQMLHVQHSLSDVGIATRKSSICDHSNQFYQTDAHEIMYATNHVMHSADKSCGPEGKLPPY